MTIARKIALGFGALLAFLAIVGAIAARCADQMIECMYARTQAIKLLQGVEDVRSILKDAETGQRGFLLVGDEAYLCLTWPPPATLTRRSRPSMPSRRASLAGSAGSARSSRWAPRSSMS